MIDIKQVLPDTLSVRIDPADDTAWDKLHTLPGIRSVWHENPNLFLVTVKDASEIDRMALVIDIALSE